MNSFYGPDRQALVAIARQERPSTADAARNALVLVTLGVLLLGTAGNADALVHDRLPENASAALAGLPWASERASPFNVPIEGGATADPSIAPERSDVCPSD